ncbi:hypothetical protein Pmani_036097 [Petrolisthes manimaculis]|uniref:DDE-1 domain-containing protein n=1 Tax=Petrolisthes manimaculis TaxID=1843537 RepID=A0AAE1TPR0_9EUCA|nr:hypothetical protein Pmani_036097 [Petrolisthes manimaculis]
MQGRNNDLLPVYWMPNIKSCTTTSICMDWFHHHFLTEVQTYLQEKGLTNKILLLLDNIPGHPPSLKGMCDNVEVMFMSTNIAYLIQPLDKGVITTFKAHYTRRSMQRIIARFDEHPGMNVIQYWNKFTISDCVSIVHESIKDLSPQTVNNCWKAIWPECVRDFEGFVPQEEEVTKAVKETVELTRQVSGEGFEDIHEGEVKELVEQQAITLKDYDMVDIVKISDDENEEEESVGEASPPKALTLEKLDEAIRLTAQLKQFVYDIDPSTVRALKVMDNIENSITPYKTLFKDMKRKRSQLPITMFFTRKPAAPTSLPPPQTTPPPPPPRHKPSTTTTTTSNPVVNCDSSDIDEPLPVFNMDTSSGDETHLQ